MALDDFSPYATHFNKSLVEYVEETKENFNGCNEDIEFTLTDFKLYWKKKSWLLGKVDVKSTKADEIVDVLFELIDVPIKQLSEQKKKSKEYEEQKQISDKVIDELKYKLNQCIILKEQMETTLYNQFLLLMNSLKAKNRELQKQLKEKHKIYDASTDEDDNDDSDKETKCDSNVVINTKINNKLQSVKVPATMQKLNIETVDQESKIQQENLVKKNETELQMDVASTSKILSSAIGEDEETPDFLSDESECEMELKLEEEKDDESMETVDEIKEENIILNNKVSGDDKTNNEKNDQDSEEMIF